MKGSKADIVASYFRAGADLRRDTIALREKVVEAADMVATAFRDRGKFLVFGNGGSAADAQHIAAELSGRFRRDRDPLPALALTVNSSAVTAIGNDYGFEEVFARQVRGLATKGDVAMGISTSGTSENVLRGLAAAQAQDAKTIGLCGRGGRMAEHADCLLAVPGDTTSLLQEVHITIGHAICLLVEEELFG